MIIDVDPERTRRVVRQARKIEGWFSPQAAGLFALLDEAQRGADIQGHLFEIGVHHGRSAVLMVALARPNERFGACDIFGGQGQNVSGSGAGNRAEFEANISRLAPNFDRLDIFESTSDQLRADQLARPIRLFHIDGGHLVDEALADLRLAAESVDPRGAIIIDDPWRVEWPGVTEAILDFLREKPDLRPVVLGFNKLVLCPLAVRDYYDEFVMRHAWDYFPRSAFASKEIPVAGHPTMVFFLPSYRTVPGIDVRVAQVRALLDRAIGPLNRITARANGRRG
jgi:hypothetical protein